MITIDKYAETMKQVLEGNISMALAVKNILKTYLLNTQAICTRL